MGAVAVTTLPRRRGTVRRGAARSDGCTAVPGFEQCLLVPLSFPGTVMVIEALVPFPVVTPIVVAWGDMDAFGHVNNTRYFRFFETARIAYFHQGALLDGVVGPILAATSCKFRAPVTFPDTVHVGARVMSVHEDRFVMEHIVWSEALQTVAARGEAVIVSYDYVQKAKASLPPAWVDAMRAIEGKEVG